MIAPFLRAVGGPFWMLTRTVGATARRGLSFAELVRSLHRIANRSAALVLSGMTFFGVVMVVIAHAQARRFTGNLSVVGPAYFELLVREFGPLVSALLAASRAGAHDASELASMTVNEQVEALEMSAGDPLADLVAPRVAAGLIGVPLLCIIGTGAALASAAFTAQFVFGADGAAFLDARFLTAGDLASATAKAFLCGLYIPLAASWRGLSTRGGASHVGRATTEGVVASVLGCLVIDLLMAIAFRLVHA
ncbi:MAG: ABC transporter permease [Myxococcaceae bacterium]|nr:ABC transporter permease [Myxococcaceae bacterium]